MKRQRLLLTFLVCLTTALAAGGVAVELATPAGKWMAGDFHAHTFFTDGSYPLTTVVRNGFQFGLHWIANSEHGGTGARDGDGRYWSDRSVHPNDPIRGDVREVERHDSDGQVIKVRVMWRWQSLIEYAFGIIQTLRHENPGRLIATGLEWNVPGHEHCSMSIVASNSEPLGEFEYRFDSSDADTSGGPDGRWRGKNLTNDHTKAVQAAEWLNEHHPLTSWVVFAHPERAARITTSVAFGTSTTRLPP